MRGWIRRAHLTMSTARHLRPRQAVALVRHRLADTPRPRRVRDADGWSPEPGLALGALGPVDAEPAISRRMSALAAGRVELLGLSTAWDPAWRYEPVTSPLWHYHVHYHDLLAEAAWSSRNDAGSALPGRLRQGLADWIDRWGNGGSPAWDAYPTCIRLVNWSRILAWTRGTLPDGLRRRMLSLHAAHVDLVGRRLERHLEGNHLLRNVWALVLGSHAWPRLRSGGPAHWRGLYFDELLAQTDEDGMHEERTPMYHVRALRDAIEALAVLDALRVEVPRSFRERVTAMAELLPWLRRMDGSLFMLNDSMQDHGVDLDRLVELTATTLGTTPGLLAGVRFLSRAGLAIAVDGVAGDRLAIDLGAPAPRHQPGHSHAGALSVEVDLGGLPVLIDPGCSGYDGDPFRPYFRSTRAHNTVTVDGKDQSEMWATFRIARRARVTAEVVRGGASDLLVRGSCQPYHDSTIRHRRSVRRVGRSVQVEDEVAGGAGTLVELLWHVHPEWTPEMTESVVVLRHVSGALATLRLDGCDRTSLHRGEKDPRLGWYAGAFEHAVPIWTVRGTVFENDHRALRTFVEPRA